MMTVDITIISIAINIIILIITNMIIIIFQILTTLRWLLGACVYFELKNAK